MQDVRIELIDRGDNDRQVFAKDEIESLAKSMEKIGLQQPVVLRPTGERFQLVAGERRWRAAKELGWDSIEARVSDLTDEEAAEIMLAENAGRADLNPIEEAEAFQKRIDQFGWREGRIAEVAGVSEKKVKSRLLLLALVPEVRRMLAKRQIPIGHCEEIADLDPNRQRLALRVMTTGGGLRLKDFRRYAAQLRAEQEQEELFDLTEFWVEQVEEKTVEELDPLDVPDDDRLPGVKVANEDVGGVLYRYARELRAKGWSEGAAAVGRVYLRLLKRGDVEMPNACK